MLKVLIAAKAEGDRWESFLCTDIKHKASVGGMVEGTCLKSIQLAAGLYYMGNALASIYCLL